MKNISKNISNKSEVLLCGSFHGNNIGDIAILESMVNSLGSTYNLTILSANEQLVRSKLTTNHPLNFVKATNPFKIIQAILKSKFVIIGGGGLFFDRGFWDVCTFWKGSQINVWWFITTFSRLLFKKVYWLGVGLGPLTRFGRHKIRMSLPFIENIHVRDRSSLKILNEKLKYTKGQKSADWVFLSESVDSVLSKHQNSKLGELDNIGLCFKLSETSKKKLQIKTKQIKSIISDFKREHPKSTIELFSTNPTRDNALMFTIAKASGVNAVDTSAMNLVSFREYISKFNILLSERMHALLLGFQQGVLGIGISEYLDLQQSLGKVAEFQREVYDKDIFQMSLDFEEIRKQINYLFVNEQEIRVVAIENYTHLQTLAEDNISILE
jgi:polysaccharide pyruvyl transferase WcaK-like protein